jgi:hypothetical protein|tara:strand:+ start:121 stop:549 length:429 start_codon:yes stop_codon:yes gene_type:complete
MKNKKKGIKMNTKKIKNFKMNNEVYKLRRQVINLIYEAKNFGIDLPRIDVRIGTAKKGHEQILGVGRMSDKKIWITEKAINHSTNYLRHVVFHEIGHAVFGLNHREDCPLMCSELDKPVTKKQALSILKEYAQLIDKLNKVA